MLPCRQVARDLLREARATRIEQDLRRVGCVERGQCAGNWLDAQDHARAAAVRIVVHAAVAPESPLAQVVGGQRGKTAFKGTSRNARPDGPGKQLRKDRDDVDAQCRHSSSASPRKPSVVALTMMRFAARSISLTTSATAGTNVSPLLPRTT